MSEGNKAVLEAANAAVTRGDQEGFLSFCTDDTLWEFVGDRTLRGKESVRRWMAASYSQGPPELTVDHLIAEGDFVTAVGGVTTRGEDGKAAHHSYCDVWRFRDGKLA
jgi:ketosteroid isomerase-like protein